MARLAPVTPNHTASATVSTGISTSFSTNATLAARLGRKMPSGCRPAPVTEQADRQRRAAERVGDVVPELRQRDVRDVDGEADHAGPDQRVLQYRHHDGADGSLLR